MMKICVDVYIHTCIALHNLTMTANSRFNLLLESRNIDVSRAFLNEVDTFYKVLHQGLRRNL